MQRKRHRRGYRHVRASLLFSFLVALSFQLITIREWDTGAIQYQILSRGELEDTWFLKEFRAPAKTKKETAKKRPTKGFARGTAHYSKKHTHKSGGEDGVGVGVGVGSESKSKSQAVLELELESELESESDSRPDAAKNKGKQRKDKKDKKEKRVVGSEKKEEKPADDDAQKGAEESNEAKLDDDKTNEQENDKEKEKTSTEQQQQQQQEQQQQEEEEEEEDAMVDDDMYFRDPGAPIADWDYYPKRKPRRDPSWSKSSSKKQAPPDKARCKRLMQTIDTSPPPRRQPSGKACKGYNGVFHIHHFDRGGASGTAFFLFTIGMLSWAEQHNFVPWIHIEDGYTEPIWDPLVHNNTNTNTNTNTKSSNNDSNNDSNSNNDNHHRSSYRAPRRVSIEDFREVNGNLLNGKRRTKSELLERHPHWNFDSLVTEEDETWTPEMEDFGDAAERGYRSLVGLLEMDTARGCDNDSDNDNDNDDINTILLVCHGGILRYLMNIHPLVKLRDERTSGESESESDRKAVESRFDNCELRKYRLSWSDNDNDNDDDNDEQERSSERRAIVLTQLDH